MKVPVLVYDFGHKYTATYHEVAEGVEVVARVLTEEESDAFIDVTVFALAFLQHLMEVVIP